MKSNIHILLSACLFLAVPVVHARPSDKGGCEVAVAALTLPDESTGLVHWRVADTASVPLQLSTRYFSERIRVPGGPMRFYSEPAEPGPSQAPPPEPLVSINIPGDSQLVYVILWAENDSDGGSTWKATLFRGQDWSAGSLKVLNACTEPVGIEANGKRNRITSGKSMDFHARDHREAFPVKIYRLEPEARLVFSSTWRVAAGRRELCFISGTGDSVSLRSLLDLAAMPAPGQR